MANNIMYLRERRTGTQIMLCKFYPSMKWYLTNSAKKELDGWLEKVTDECVLHHGADEVFGPSSFELAFDHVETKA